MDRLRRGITPVVRIVRSFGALNSRRLAWVAILGIGGSSFNAAGYLALTPLVRQVALGGESMAFGPFETAISYPSMAGVLAVVVVLLTGALQLNFTVHRLSLDILRRTTTEATVRGLSKLNGLPRDFDRKRAVHEIAGPVAFACGLLMRQVALGLAETLQLCVFLGVMLWISPSLTLLFIALATMGAYGFARAFREVARVTSESREYSSPARREWHDLRALMTEGVLSDAELRKRVEHLHLEGASGALLDRKLDIRREMKRGPMLIEYLYPVVLIVLPLLAIATGEFRAQAGLIIVFVLVLRNAIGLLHKLAALLISVGRHYPSLLCYVSLQSETPGRGCRFAKPTPHETIDDDEDETY